MPALAKLSRLLRTRVRRVWSGMREFVRNAPRRLWSMARLGIGGTVGTLVGLAVLTFVVKALV